MNFRYGASKWRDSAHPTEILYDWLNNEGLPEPQWEEDNKRVTIGDSCYNLDQFGIVLIYIQWLAMYVHAKANAHKTRAYNYSQRVYSLSRATSLTDLGH